MKILSEQIYNDFMNNMKAMQIDEIECRLCNQTLQANDIYYYNPTLQFDYMICDACLTKHANKYGY